MSKRYTTLYSKRYSESGKHISVLLVQSEPGTGERVIVETPHELPDTGPYVYSQYEQATGDRYEYIDAMVAGSMMRPSALHAAALVIGIGSGQLSKQVAELHRYNVLSIDNSQEVINLAEHYFGYKGAMLQSDGYAYVRTLCEQEYRPAPFGTVYVDVFGLNDKGELNIPAHFLMERFYDYVHRILQDKNSMLVVNLGDSAIGGPQHGEVRRILQYLGTIFDRVYVSKVADTSTHNGNLVVACLKHPGADKDFYLPSDYQASQTDNRIPIVGYDKKVKFQRFHAFGKISNQAVPQYVENVNYRLNYYDKGFHKSLWSEFGGSARSSLTHDAEHMHNLWKKASDAGEYAHFFTQELRHDDDVVAILPAYVDKTCATPDGQVVYTHCMLGEDIIINYEPLIDVAYFPTAVRFLPSYISQDISFHYSDRVFRSIQSAGFDPYALFPGMGVCLFEYEVTRIRPLDELYSLMPRDTRKEAQRLMRNAQANFMITYGDQIPEVDPSWQSLLSNYLSYRKDLDDELEGTEGFVSSVEGTNEHLEACRAAQRNGLLRTVSFRDKDQQLVAVNFAIVHPDSETVADVVCIRNCDHEWKRYGLGVVAILCNYELMSHEEGSIKWYDLGNMGTENTYKYKQMFFTDLVFRFGVAKAGPCMLIEAAMKDSGYIFPMSLVGVDVVPVNNRDDAESLFLDLDLETIRDVQEYYESLPIQTPMRQRIKERLDAIIFAKEQNNVRRANKPVDGSEAVESTAIAD